MNTFQNGIADSYSIQYGMPIYIHGLLSAYQPIAELGLSKTMQN